MEDIESVEMKIGDRYTKLCKRFDLSGQAHELTFCCYKNQNFLSKQLTCDFLAKSINKASKVHKFEIWAYVFMPNHVHLLVFSKKKEYSISKFLLAIKQPVSQKAITYLKNNNPKGLKKLKTGQQDVKFRFWQKVAGMIGISNR